MIIITGKNDLDRVIADTVERAQKQAASDIRKQMTAFGSLRDLQQEIETLKIEKGRREEDFAKQKREVEHKVGLERKRQEFEVEATKRDTELSVREENLSADRDRFKDEMDFQRVRLEKEVKSTRDLVEKLLERLPSAEIIANINTPKRRAG